MNVLGLLKNSFLSWQCGAHFATHLRYYYCYYCQCIIINFKAKVKTYFSADRPLPVACGCFSQTFPHIFDFFD